MVALALLAVWLETANIPNSGIGFDFSRVDGSVVSALKRAWMLAEQGRSAKEAGVLLTETAGGAYSASVVFDPSEMFQVRFTVTTNTVALFHTHPNKTGSKPSPQDRSNADMLGIPTFIMTDRGLWVYDPKTRQTSLVMVRLSWLNPRIWNEKATQRTGF